MQYVPPAQRIPKMQRVTKPGTFGGTVPVGGSDVAAPYQTVNLQELQRVEVEPITLPDEPDFNYNEWLYPSDFRFEEDGGTEEGTAASDGSDAADESDESDDSDNPHDASTTNQAAPASDDSAESDIPDHAPTTTHAEIADDSEESDYADDTPTNTAQTNIPSTTTALTNIAPTNNNNLAPIPLNIQRMADTIKACRRHPGTNGLWQRVGMRKALPNEFNKNHNNLRQSLALYNYVGDTRLFTAREWEHITEVDRT